MGSDRGLELGEGRSIGRRLAHVAGREFELGQWDVADIAFGVVHVGLRDCVNAEPGGDTLFGIRPRPPSAQALALMSGRRSQAEKLVGFTAWRTLLSGLVGLTVGLPCSQVGTLFASVALVRIPNSYPGGFSETVRRNRPSIPLAAGAAFRRRGPSRDRRLSARQRFGHTPPGPAPTASGRSATARSCDQTSVAPAVKE